jgi:hypothetical protein
MNAAMTLDPLTKTLHAIAGVLGFKTDPTVLAYAKDFLKKHRDALQEVAKFGHDKVSETRRRQFKHGIEVVSKGTPEKPYDGGYLSAAQIAEQMNATRLAIKEGIRELERQAVIVIRPESERFVAEAREFLNEMELQEKKVAADFAIEYAPSPTLVAARKALEHVPGYLPRLAWIAL